MQLMYRPPRAEKHEKISETLDRLHYDIERMLVREHIPTFSKSKGIPPSEDIG